MKLAVSNVAWYTKEIDGFLRFIKGIGCQGIELAPSMLWDEPINASLRERLELRKKIEDSGLKLVGLQALLYAHRDFLIFKDDLMRQKIIDYFNKLMDFCVDLGGELLVFGSPGNRNINNVPAEMAYAIAVDFFRKVGQEAGERGIFFCIEPLGKKETDFINTVAEAEKLISDVGNPKGFGLHIDVKGIIDEDEVDAPYLTQSFSHAKHIHLNDPGLTPPGSTGYDHRRVRARMEGSNYARFVSIEMKRQDLNVENAIHSAVEYVKKVYFG